MCNSQQAELNFNLLKPTKMEPLKCLLFLRFPNTASTSCGRWLRYFRPSSSAFHVLSPWFFSDGDLPVQFFPSGFCDTGILTGNPCSYVPCILIWSAQNRCLSSFYIGESFHSLSHRTSTCRRFLHYNKSWKTETGRSKFLFCSLWK